MYNMKKVNLSPKNKSNDGIEEFTEHTNKRKHYEFLEAKNTVEYIEHFLESTKHIIDRNPAKPKDYDKWTNKEQYEHIISNVKTYIPGIPDSLLFFIPAALHRGDCGRNSTDKPLWLDMDKFRRGQQFARDHFFTILFANILSLFNIFAFADGLKPIILSQQSHTPRLAFKRYLSTTCRVQNWLLGDPWTVGTEAHKDIQIVRKMHRAMRARLCELDNKKIDMATKIPHPWCPDRERILKDFSSCPYPTVENGCLHLLVKPKGLNQADMGATQFAFIGMILLYPREFGIHVSDNDMAAFCHTWRGIGYLLGIEDQYNFCRGNLEEIKQRSHDFVELWIKSYLRQVTPEWEHMMRCITESLTFHIGGSSFKTLLLFVTNLLNIDMPHLQSSLTFSERLHLMFYRFLFRYAMKLRLIRELLNNIMHKVLNKAVKYGPEKYKKLQTRDPLK